MSHTKGKLYFIDHRGQDIDAIDIVDYEINRIASMKGLNSDKNHNNARRIVTCWNALLPFTTEQIEAGIDLVKLVQERDALKAEVEQWKRQEAAVRLIGEVKRDDLKEENAALKQELSGCHSVNEVANKENASFKVELERFQYLKDNFVRCEPKMDGEHYWIAKGRTIGRGNTFEEAIDSTMKEFK
jgi:FtsZ-binding cell division protein ZapB